VDNLVDWGIKGKISTRCVSNIIRFICNNPRITSKEILSNLNVSGMKVLKQTLQRTMRCNGLKGCRPRKTPLLTEKHVKAHLKIAKTPVNSPTSFVSMILWRDETKIELFGSMDVAYVWRKKGEAHNPKNSILTFSTWGRESYVLRFIFC